MGKPTGFKEIPRQTRRRRPVELRVLDWDEIYVPMEPGELRQQGARCMDCGVPFCNDGCPLGNQIPDWNDLIYRDRWYEALQALERTNNFPEFTGRICPAPCEEACVLSINDQPVTIKTIEQAIADKGWAEGWIKPQPPEKRTGKKIAVVGSGPAGLAAAQQLNRAGHNVVVFERDDRPGGLLVYGIPDFKMDKSTVARRCKLLEDEGIEIRCGVNVGVDVTTEQLRHDFDAILLCTGATKARDADTPGRDLTGIHYAMTYLPQQTKLNHGDQIFAEQAIDAKDKHVIIIGGGDTAADCLGTALRQGAASIKQFDINAMPPSERSPEKTWPQWPMVLRTSAAHEEGEQKYADLRNYAILTKEFIGDDAGHVRQLRAVKIESYKDETGKRHITELEGSEMDLPCDLCLLAIGFSGPETYGPIEDLNLNLTKRDAIKVGEDYMTNVEGVFAAGDSRRGQSLVVWAISEGRQAARCIDKYLMGYSDLPELPVEL
ncbi:MAG: glutamate synthase subunit beta [Planctomycetota bacterium]